MSSQVKTQTVHIAQTELFFSIFKKLLVRKFSGTLCEKMCRLCEKQTLDYAKI